MERTAGKRSDCVVLVTSCDAYADVEAPFVELWRKYWPDCPWELVLLTETAAGDSRFDRVLQTGRGKTWCEMLVEALDALDAPWVLLVMNDYLLEAPVDTARVVGRLEQARRFDAANLRLNPLPPGRMPWPETDLREMPKNVAYCVTCQTGFWRRDYLRGLAARNKSAWEFERFGSFMLADETRPLLVTATKEFPFVDAVHKGYWERAGVRLLRDNAIVYDFARRGLPPLRVRFVEGLKKLVFALFPWTVVVRVQNAFGVGKK